MSAARAAPQRCPACGSPLNLIRVHGHGQCAVCGTNVEPCCGGAGDEADRVTPGAEDAGVALVLEILAERAPILENDFLNAFSARSGCGFEVGKQLLREALRKGRARRAPSGVISLPQDAGR